MIDRYPQQPLLPTGKMLAVHCSTCLSLSSERFVVIALLALFPRTSFYQRFALINSNPPGPSLAGAQIANRPVRRNGEGGHRAGFPGARASPITLSMWSPSEFIARETPSDSHPIDGMRVVVRAAVV